MEQWSASRALGCETKLLTGKGEDQRLKCNLCPASNSITREALQSFNESDSGDATPGRMHAHCGGRKACCHPECTLRTGGVKFPCLSVTG